MQNRWNNDQWEYVASAAITYSRMHAPEQQRLKPSSHLIRHAANPPSPPTLTCKQAAMQLLCKRHTGRPHLVCHRLDAWRLEVHHKVGAAIVLQPSLRLQLLQHKHDALRALRLRVSKPMEVPATRTWLGRRCGVMNLAELSSPKV